MTTTVELTDIELSEMCEATHQPDASAAVRTAMTEYLHSIRDRDRSAGDLSNQMKSKVTVKTGWKMATFSVPPDAPIIPGDLASQLLAEEGP